MVLSLILVMAFCNFTDRDRGKTFAGFPRRLFTLPVSTWLLVTCPMLFGVVSIVGVYVAWAKLVFQPAGVEVLVRWPALLLAAGMVSYQTIIWCLRGFRFLRLIVLSVMLTLLVALGLAPYALAPGGQGRLEGILTAALAACMLGAYGAAVAGVACQRRGGGRGWQWVGLLRQGLEDALPRSKRPFASPERALMWLEWRRGGLVLPAAVLLTFVLIVGPGTWLAGRGPEATARAALWLALLPMILALPVGKGLAKPDFWSLELGLNPFLTTRPVSDGQVVAAKMKAAALSTLLAWALLLTLAPLWLWLVGDVADLYSNWKVFCAVYSPFARVAIPMLLLNAAIILTWGLLIGGIWAGASGRPVVFAGSIVFGIVCFMSLLAFVTWWGLDGPGRSGRLRRVRVAVAPLDTRCGLPYQGVGRGVLLERSASGRLAFDPDHGRLGVSLGARYRVCRRPGLLGVAACRLVPRRTIIGGFPPGTASARRGGATGAPSQPSSLIVVEKTNGKDLLCNTLNASLPVLAAGEPGRGRPASAR